MADEQDENFHGIDPHSKVNDHFDDIEEEE